MANLPGADFCSSILVSFKKVDTLVSKQIYQNVTKISCVYGILTFCKIKISEKYFTIYAKMKK
jgi:hypothetical protein